MNAHRLRTLFGRRNVFALALALSSSLVFMCGLSFSAAQGPEKEEREVDDGRELFGNFTPQPPPPAGRERNGFLALALYDAPARGGDGDGVIDERDRVFASLRLWRDANHNGLSEPGGLHTLPALGLSRLHLDYKESKRADAYGNLFRYRAKADDARGAKAGRWAWDVFLVGEQ
ncbi:MAG TPA: hypothetical protein VF736_03410 [Pyrinomonadaceae bacterium]|jgi:hypothetical protein